MTHQATLLDDGRLHLHHGPIDLLIRAWGSPAGLRAAYAAATHVFPTILPALCAERQALSRAVPSQSPYGPVARAMHKAATNTVIPGHGEGHNFLTPMAAVAGAVADHVRNAMVQAAPLAKAFVNNGGDIAFHLAPGQSLRCGLVTDLAVPSLSGTMLLHSARPSRGLATSGRACKGKGGRSFSLGVADAVTILAPTAAAADAAATVVANAVDLPGHPAITRVPADGIDPDSDLGSRRVTWDVGPLTPAEIHCALQAGERVARKLLGRGLIHAAILALRGQYATTLPDAIAA